MSVSLEVLQEYDLSFFEAGILERVRYFSEYDETGSGWCYVGKERLAKEFNVSRQSIIAVVDRLAKKGLFTKNQKGWIKVNKGVKKLDCKETLHVKKLDTTCKETLHNIILNKDIHTNDIISSIDSNSVVSKNLTGKETRHVKKVDSKHWKKMSREEYHEYQLGLGRKPRGDAGIVYISDENIGKLVNKYGSVYLRHAIAILGAQKEKKGYNEYGCDYSVFHKPWLHDETIKMLKIHNIDYQGAHFKEIQAYKRSKELADEQEMKQKRITNPELFSHE